MSQFIGMAEEVRKNFDGKDIDSHISKYASDKGLNDNEKQRLIEEVNVGTFLEKLSNGTHHEDFPIADPVITHTNGDKPILESTELSKAASVSFRGISPDMFNIDIPEPISHSDEMLFKTASHDENSVIMDSEEKWDNAEKERSKIIDDYDTGLAKTASENDMYTNLGTLVKYANESEGMTKTAVAILSMNELDDLAETVLDNSKYSTHDIAESKAEELTKEAKKVIEKVVKEIKKNPTIREKVGKIGTDALAAGKGLKDVLAFPVKHPIVATVPVAGGLYAASSRMDRPDKERMEMSLRSFKNEQEY